MGTVKINTGYKPEEMKNSEWVGSGGGGSPKGRTPDKIKKGLEQCAETETCENCDYRDDCMKQLKNAPLTKDALAYIQHLESHLAQVERERDAAVADLQLYAGCKVCKYGDFKFTNECMDCSYDNNNWQWRGVCPENTKEE